MQTRGSNSAGMGVVVPDVEVECIEEGGGVGGVGGVGALAGSRLPTMGPSARSSMAEPVAGTGARKEDGVSQMVVEDFVAMVDDEEDGGQTGVTKTGLPV